MKDSSIGTSGKPPHSQLTGAIIGRILDLVLLILAFLIIMKVIPWSGFSSGNSMIIIFSVSIIVILLMTVLIFRNAIIYKEWCIFPPQKRNKESNPLKPADPDHQSLKEQISRILSVISVIFLYLLVISSLLGLPKRALAPPLTFSIFFWIFIIEVVGFIACYLLAIRLSDGKWSLVPRSGIISALGDGSQKLFRILLFWNGLCILWVIVNLCFLYSGNPQIDSDTYGMGLGIMVAGNLVIGLILGLASYRN